MKIGKFILYEYPIKIDKVRPKRIWFQELYLDGVF